MSRLYGCYSYRIVGSVDTDEEDKFGDYDGQHHVLMNAVGITLQTSVRNKNKVRT